MMTRKVKVCHEGKLKLRPFWLGDISVLQRLNVVLKNCKDNSILLGVLKRGTEKATKIFTPVNKSLMGLKNIIKKVIFKTFSKVQSLEDQKVVYGTKRKLRRYKYHRKNAGKKSTEFVPKLDEGGTSKYICPEVVMSSKSVYSSNKRYNTRSTTVYRNECRTCHEDYAACKTCSSCLEKDPTLPLSSCAKCQKKGPVVNLCTKFHNKQPIIHLPENQANEELFDKFRQRREILKEVSKFCKGDSPKINHCPMCSTIRPHLGECTCQNCNKLQPILKITKRNKNTVVEMCPCQHCSRQRPKVKVCEDCKNINLKKAKSYYVILSSK